MFYKIVDKKTGQFIGSGYICHGCGTLSDRRKTSALPKGWVSKDELYYNENGNHVKRSGWVTNYYCSSCDRMGMTSQIVATVTKKLRKRAKKKRA